MFVDSPNIRARMSNAHVWSFYVTYVLASKHSEGVNGKAPVGHDCSYVAR